MALVTVKQAVDILREQGRPRDRTQVLRWIHAGKLRKVDSLRGYLVDEDELRAMPTPQRGAPRKEER
jgi:hypothetical protein